MRPLSLLEARVLGVLVEKAHTVPDSYPLSLNALTLGCNQKTARDPVLNASDADVQAAVDALRALSLAFESSGSRVSRYEHNVGRALGVPSQSVALLATLVLRGPQTVSELRSNSERLHRFADLSAVEGFLDELAARPQEKGGPLVVKLPRAPGSREARWAHLLGGSIDTSSMPAAAESDVLLPDTELAALKSRLTATEAEVARLAALVARVCAELDIQS
ncbi:MAG TPA: YceH family protein [Caldimonas sp.]|nr:YceH family protein [Caldimonas sp.]HEX2541582.1 YceH family protein [Caldimonas sp.]